MHRDTEETTDGDELHNHAHGVQMWCISQVLIGKLFETWNMLSERLLGSNPQDPAIAQLSETHKRDLSWLEQYFGDGQPKVTPLGTVREKTVFHYDKLNLDEAVKHNTEGESRKFQPRTLPIKMNLDTLNAQGCTARSCVQQYGNIAATPVVSGCIIATRGYFLGRMG